MITDDSDDGETKVRIIKMEKLGNIYIDENLHVDAGLTSKREEVDSTIRDNLAHWRRRIEEVVAAATSINIANLHHIYSFFIPVEGIVNAIDEQGYVATSDFSVLKSTRPDTYFAYAKLLEGQDLLERHNGRWRPTIALKQLISSEDSLHGMTKRVIAALIAERYRTLREDFKITLLERPIKLQNVVYLPEIEIEHHLLRTRNTLNREYFYHYNDRVVGIDMNRLLKNLIEIDSVKYDQRREMYHGEDTLLESMIKEKANIRPLDSLHSTRA
jgi:hypothetical protein